jgi:hypothetical protein
MAGVACGGGSGSGGEGGASAKGGTGGKAGASGGGGKAGASGGGGGVAGARGGAGGIGGGAGAGGAGAGGAGGAGSGGAGAKGGAGGNAGTGGTAGTGGMGGNAGAAGTGGASAGAGGAAGAGGMGGSAGGGAGTGGTAAVLACPDGGTLTFDDDFSAGLRPQSWTVTQTTTGLFAVDATQGNLQLTKVGSNTTSALQNVAVVLNLASLGGSIAGDFDYSVEFSNVVQGSGGVDQVELHAHFADSSYFFDVYDNSDGGANVHVWTGSINGRMAGAHTAGTFRISRVGTTLSGYLGGTLIYSQSSTSPLTGAELVLQLQPGSNDNISVVYDNFHFTAACGGGNAGSGGAGGGGGGGGGAPALGWVLVRIGDCPGTDRAIGYSTTNDVPVEADCTHAENGLAAVCWDQTTYHNELIPAMAPGCTYKTISADACSGGTRPGYLYVCNRP